MAASFARFVAAGPWVRAVSFGHSMQTASRVGRTRWGLSATAASLLALTLAVWWYLAQPVPDTDTRFQTAIGEHASVALPDSSTLSLNSNSLARVEYSARARIIHLERGEAFFEVQHDTQRPFWVVAGHSWVRAVGTAFNVYVRPSDVQVTVSEGTVKVAALPEALSNAPSDQALATVATSIVTAGEQVQVRSAGAALRALAPAELTRSIAWRTGALNFEHAPLEQVVDELSRYSTVKIVIQDPALRQFPVGGTFEANGQGVEALLVMLQEGLGLKVDREGDERATIERVSSPTASK